VEEETVTPDPEPEAEISALPVIAPPPWVTCEKHNMAFVSPAPAPRVTPGNETAVDLGSAIKTVGVEIVYGAKVSVVVSVEAKGGTVWEIVTLSNSNPVPRNLTFLNPSPDAGV
jgi:hypothetical protein